MITWEAGRAREPSGYPSACVPGLGLRASEPGKSGGWVQAEGLYGRQALWHQVSQGLRLAVFPIAALLGRPGCPTALATDPLGPGQLRKPVRQSVLPLTMTVAKTLKAPLGTSKDLNGLRTGLESLVEATSHLWASPSLVVSQNSEEEAGETRWSCPCPANPRGEGDLPRVWPAVPSPLEASAQELPPRSVCGSFCPHH